MLSFKSAARALASLAIVAFAAGLFAAPSIAQVQTVGSPIGLQTAYAGMKSRPWYADQPNYFKPFDFQWADGKFWVNGWAGVIAEAELSSILFTADYSTGDVGLVYLAIAGASGAVFLWLAVRQLREADNRAAVALFRYSISYLALIFGAMVVDRLLPL